MMMAKIVITFLWGFGYQMHEAYVCALILPDKQPTDIVDTLSMLIKLRFTVC